MADEFPRTTLTLLAHSWADELGFLALADLSAALAACSGDVSCRLVGGHMVTLLAQRWGLGPHLCRETLDADLGVATLALRQGLLIEQLEAMGYEKASGCRYVRPVSDISSLPPNQDRARHYRATIDLLAPAYTKRARPNVTVEKLQTTEVPGLAVALNRSPLRLDLTLVRMDGTRLTAILDLPDEASAIIIKALTWQVRGQTKDAIDLWRCLEIAAAAQVHPEDIQGDDGARAKEVIRRVFADKNSAGTQALVRGRNLSGQAAVRLRTRVRALALRLAP
jgi:hypothetical protein